MCRKSPERRRCLEGLVPAQTRASFELSGTPLLAAIEKLFETVGSTRCFSSALNGAVCSSVPSCGSLPARHPCPSPRAW